MIIVGAWKILKHIVPKIKIGGIMSGHDYHTSEEVMRVYESRLVGLHGRKHKY